MCFLRVWVWVSVLVKWFHCNHSRERGGMFSTGWAGGTGKNSIASKFEQNERMQQKPMKNYFTDLAITRVFEREHIFNFSWKILPTFDNNLFHTDCRTSERACEHPQLNRIVKRNSLLPLICSWFCGVYDRVLCRWISNMLMFPWNSNFHHFSKVKPNANFVRNDAQKCWGCLAKW